MRHYGFSSEEAEDEESNEEGGPLNLSKRVQNVADHESEINSKSESSQEDDTPLNLCLRAQSKSQTHPASTGTGVSNQVGTKDAQGCKQFSLAEPDQCDRRHSAAFALCQLASSSKICASDPPSTPEADTQSSNCQLPAPNQAPVLDTPHVGDTKHNAPAQGQKRTNNGTSRKSNKRAKVKDLVRVQRKRMQNC